MVEIREQGEPAGAVTARSWAFSLLALQVALLFLLVHRFHIESATFRTVFATACLAALVHALLPSRVRLPFFVGVSLATTCWVVGLRGGVWVAEIGVPRFGLLIGIGLALAGICRLRVPWIARVALLALAGVVLALFRAGLFEFGPLDALWPVLGAMFMFRLLLYFYDIQHEKERPGIWQTLAYFFMLPNACLPLFPVIDYKTFWRTYKPEPRMEVYQRGVDWMLRGIIHLLLWRIVYYQLYLDPSRVENGTDLIRYALSNIALYLRVSGQFHLVIGLLHLFGFDLPEANKRYFLASSFTDYWRRVNIYWKDFIMKLFYYPAVFVLKSWTPTAKLITATVWAFVFTWALHSYQWFWLRGDFPVRAQDVVFWTALMVLVIINSLIESKRGRKRSLGVLKRTPIDWLKLALSTGGTFAVVTFLWSMWSSDSLAQFGHIWSLADRNTALWGLGAIILIMLLSVLSEATTRTPVKAPIGRGTAPVILDWRPVIRGVIVPCLALLALSSVRVTDHLSPSLKQYTRSLSQTKPNKSDDEFLVRSYYEDLMDTTRFDSLLSEAENTRPPGWRNLENTEAIRPTGDLRTKELVPGMSLLVNGKTLRINNHGMRDREYTVDKPDGCYRIALLGSSIEMAWNVDMEFGFEHLLEERLNADRQAAGLKPIEILNFSVNGYGPIAQVDVFRKQVIPFEPDAVLVFGHPEDHLFVAQQITRALRAAVPLEDAALTNLLKRAGIDARTPDAKIRQRLEVVLPELLLWANSQVVETAKNRGITPIWVYLPGIIWSGPDARDQIYVAAAREAGFEVVTLYGVLSRCKPSEVSVAPWDGHPNERGHALVADALWTELVKLPALRLIPNTAQK